MALSSFIANCFKYLWVSKMKPICIPQIFNEDSEFINHYRQKNSLYMFFFLFETSKSWNCWPFYPTGTMSRIHTFEKRQCDRCQHRSAVKNTPPPSLSFPVPIPPPHPTTPAPTAQGQWYRAFWILWPPRPMAWRPWRTAYAICSVPRPPLLPSAGKTGSSSGEKGLSLSEGLAKEYMTWRETSVAKTGTQAEGRHVVIRASQG